MTKRNSFTFATVERFISPEPNSGCWLWTAITTEDGYGRVTINGKKYLAHRLTYTFLVDQIPNGLVLDHLCRVPTCCNPAHLEPVTNRENTIRGDTYASGWCRNKTHCPKGHPYLGYNLYTHKNGNRACRTCHREAEAARRIRLKQGVILNDA